MDMKKRILLVDDEPELRRMVASLLTGAGYEVAEAADCAQARAAMAAQRPDAVLLDVMLPDGDGFSLLPELRRFGDVPVLYLSARDEDAARLQGLGLGADDYITKPFDPSQLVARVRSHLKRYRRLTEKQAPAGEPDRITVKDLVIEPKNWKVWKGGTELKLPNREFELLRFLAENPNLVFSKEELFEKIWGFDYVSDAATVSVHVNRLWEKIEDDARNPRIIETVWGAGYRLNL